MIGTDIGGTSALGNTFDGVYINNAPSNVIGGRAPPRSNVISANGGNRRVTSSGFQATANVDPGEPHRHERRGSGDLGEPTTTAFASARTLAARASAERRPEPATHRFNEGDGVMVDRSIGNAILGNSIFSTREHLEPTRPQTRL